MKKIEKVAEDWLSKHPDATPIEIFIAGHKYKPASVELTEELKHKREIEFAERLEPYINKYGSKLCSKFALYWTQWDGPKMFWEKQKVFDLPKRLETFRRNDYGNRATTKQDEVGSSVFDRADQVLRTL